jgi:subtilisin family serine protease
MRLLLFLLLLFNLKVLLRSSLFPALHHLQLSQQPEFPYHSLKYFYFRKSKIYFMKNLIVASSLLISSVMLGQKTAPTNWMLLDPKADHIYGTGIEEAYKTLKDKKAKTVIVAVIDGGTDIAHEDLKDVLWVNEKEIPGNNIDDDKNGYTDDINGWSFLGGKNGDINYEATELARMYHRMNKKFRNADESTFSPADAKEYEEFKKIRTTFLSELKNQENQLASIEFVEKFLKKVKDKNNGKLDKDALKNYVAENETEEKLKKGLKTAITFGIKIEELEGQLVQGKEQFSNLVKYNKMNTDSIRQYIVGDNIDDPNERYYGNNNVKGPDALHGSHVAGIIAAARNNSKGIDGIASNVKIMVLRAVPNGDERDKDIANAIRYAVDNGATVINMSFGKYYSPDKQVVDDAVRYAMSKDVLLIHAAGNESKNNDVELSFPSRELANGEIAPNWIQVGASAHKKGKKLIGGFSNYGQKKVDLFAPGVEIYSTAPENLYINESGTSMASPATAGVAAVIRGYFPELKANEVRDVLMRNVVTYRRKVKVPGGKEKKRVKELCISGGFVNANNAVKDLMGLGKK